MFTNIFSFHGRINRQEYALSFLTVLVISFVLNAIAMALTNEKVNQIVQLVIYLPTLWFTLSQIAKRSHDIGNSGWYIVIPLYAIYLFFIESDWGVNEYGLNPNGEGNGEDNDAYNENAPLDSV